MAFGLPNAPWDIRLGSYFFRLVRAPDTGRLVWRRTPLPMFPARVAEGATTQANMPPDARIPFTFPDRADGFGLPRIDGVEEVHRYRYTTAREGMTKEGVDCSLGYLAVLSGKVNEVTLSSTPTGAAPKFIAYKNSLYLVGGRYVYKMDGTYGWSQTADLGASIAATDAVTFKGTQSQEYLHLAVGTGAPLRYSTDGITFTAGSAGDEAELLAKVGDRVYRMLNGETWWADDGGANPTFQGAILIGDNLGSANQLYAHADRVVVGKSTGLFVHAQDSTSLEQNLEPEMWTNGTDADVYTRGINFRGQLLVRFRGGIRSYSPGFSVNEVGPNTIVDNDSPAKGNVTALAADAHHVYCTLDSGYLMKGLPVHNVVDGSIQAIKWHTFLYLGGTGALAMTVWHGTSGTDPQLYLYQGAGLVQRVVLSRTGNPLTDTRYQFCPGGVLVEPDYYGGFALEPKLLFSMGVDAERLTATETLQHGYRLPTDAAWTDLATLQSVTPGTPVDLAVPAKGRSVSARVTFQTGSASLTPALRTHSLSYLVASTPIPTVSMQIDLTDGAMLADGSNQRVDPATAARRLYQLVNTGPLTFIDPWGEQEDVTLPLEGYQDDAGLPHDDRPPDKFVAIRVVGQKPRQAGTFAILATRRFSELSGLTFRQLRELT